ncbi:hypothetical protein OIU84_018556 [Salix udensis]|uniref:alpha-galactosidase n=1 Tax=Salix udensis TaxID=889485 RepID=A0AAD6PJY1_9ROSI|nr:hypothetical protein OIU84_018556 [Salix udensis]
MAKDISGLVNMYRVTGDDWDTWGEMLQLILMFQGTLLLLIRLIQVLTEDHIERVNLNLNERKNSDDFVGNGQIPSNVWRRSRTIRSFLMLLVQRVLHIRPWRTAKDQEDVWRKLANHIHSFWVSLAAIILKLTVGPLKLLTKILTRYAGKRTWEAMNLYAYTSGKTRLASDEGLIYNEGELRLFANDGMEFCLDASPRHKRTSRELKSGSFSPCRSDANQMWELNNNGSLVSSYSGLCATVKSTDANVGSSRVRSWIATGRKGEIYVALFNLNSEKTVISATISDLTKALPGRSLNATSCHGTEVWSGKDFGKIKDSISMEVEIHGCALFVLNCP